MASSRLALALSLLFLGLALPVGPAHGGPSEPPEPDPEEQSALPSWLIASRLCPPPEDIPAEEVTGGMLLQEPPLDALDPDPLTLTTSREASSDLRTLVGRGERWNLMRFAAGAFSAPQAASLKAYGTVAYVPGSILGARPGGSLGFGPLVAPGSPLGLALDEPEEPISLGVKARLDGLEGGVEHRAVGKRLERVVAGPPSQQDREGTEVWLARRLGLLRLKLSQSDLTDNVDRDPALPRTARAQTAVSAELTPPGWPALGLTYATGKSERFWLDGGGTPRATELRSFDSIAGSAYYGGSSWDVAGTSTYSSSRQVGRPAGDMTMLYHDLTLTLRLLDALTVTPTVAAGLDRYDRSDATNQVGAASVLFSYSPTTSPWSLWTLAAYTTSQASDRTADGRTVSVSGGLVCGLGRFMGGRATLSVEAGYERYDDSIYPESSTRGAFGLLLVRVAAF